MKEGERLLVRMWCLMFMLCSLFSSLHCKEYASDVNLGDDEMDIIFDLVKRLENNGESGHNDHPHDSHVPQNENHDKSDGDQTRGPANEYGCGVTVMDDRIIRTNESIHNGASFLGLSRETVSQGACTDLCCKKPSCDTAVFEKKGEHKCFLFRCQELCRFSRHSSFSSITVHRRAVSPPPSSSTPPFSTTANSSAPGRGGNHGGVTTSPAPSAAAGGGLPHSGGPSPQGAPLSNSTEGQQPQGKGPHTQGEDPGPVYDYVFIEEKNDTAPEKNQQKEGKPTGDQQTEHQPSSEDQNSQSASKEKQDKQQVSNTTILEEETPEKHTTTTTTTTTSRPKHTTKVDSTPPTADRATPKKPTSTTPTTSATSSHGQFISREKIGESVEVNDLQVPIIALSVGLSFTLILLVFVGCRLCTVRRQLRKGRPLHSNEADYLINGMYL